MRHIKRNDLVMVINGEEKKGTGKVLKVFSKQGRAIVEGLNIVKKASRPTKINPQGGIVKKEGSIHLSNLMLFCPKCKQPAKIGHKFLSDGAKVRTCKKCGEII
ncbi:MAG: 50S ribosomal protein L24 [Candidatus Omnitrophota bacterium]|nr:50S ribosomal protein L24 [Candidatus Omnitrophota bacterium]